MRTTVATVTAFVGRKLPTSSNVCDPVNAAKVPVFPPAPGWAGVVTVT